MNLAKQDIEDQNLVETPINAINRNCDLRIVLFHLILHFFKIAI